MTQRRRGLFEPLFYLHNFDGNANMHHKMQMFSDFPTFRVAGLISRKPRVYADYQSFSVQTRGPFLVWAQRGSNPAETVCAVEELVDLVHVIPALVVKDVAVNCFEYTVRSPTACLHDVGIADADRMLERREVVTEVMETAREAERLAESDELPRHGRQSHRTELTAHRGDMMEHDVRDGNEPIGLEGLRLFDDGLTAGVVNGCGVDME